MRNERIGQSAVEVRPGRKYRAVAGIALGALLACGAMAQSGATLKERFLNPPDDAKPMMRWWWFGPSVVQPELARELDEMHRAGIGGVEIAAEYPQALDDASKGIKNEKYLSPSYLKDVRFAAEHAWGLGMRVDITLGSGWPFGGPHIPIQLAAGRLKTVVVPLNGGGKLPKLDDGDSFIAAFVADGTPSHYDAAHAVRTKDTAMPAQLVASNGKGPQVELIFLNSHTRQAVKRAAYGAEGYVLDHMSRAAIDQHLRSVGDPLLSAFPTRAPYAIFSDSLEVYGADWTPDLPAEFAKRRGYDLIAHLPELVQGDTAEAEAVRRDWGVTLAELVNENYLHPVAEYAQQHGTRFRSQTYGEPAVRIIDERVPQLPEGEGPQWRSFSFTRWASSANHLFGNPVTSAETWTWVHSPVFRATPLDLKVEADRMFIEGVNQIIGHGFPYSAPGATEPGWSLYAAGALNDHNPWWPVMPHVTRYLQRVSWLLRQGEPANDIAILLPEADAQANYHPGHVSITAQMKQMLSPDLMAAVLDSGYNVDYVDENTLVQGIVRHPVLIVPPTKHLSLQGERALAAYAKQGGKIVFVGETPSETEGLLEAKEASLLRSEMATLLSASSHVATEGQLGTKLQQLIKPDVVLGAAAGKVGFIHRHAKEFDVYFIANSSPVSATIPSKVRAERKYAEWWDADSGRAWKAVMGKDEVLAPYESRALILTDEELPHREEKAVARATARPAINLTHWTMKFPGSASSAALPEKSAEGDLLWSNAAATRNYSGEVQYLSTFHVDGLKQGERVVLRFADSKPLEDTQPANKPGTRAWLEAPIREAAIVVVNGKEVGALWHPPYAIDVTSAVVAGENKIELRVFNTAINAWAAQPKRDYSALKAKYGDRFQMQDIDNLQPVASGIEGPVQIEFQSEK